MRDRHGWLLLVPILFTAFVYLPVSRNYFYADDFLNLYRIANVNLSEYLLVPNGGHLLLTRNALFYLFHSVFGTRPEPYFWVVLATHLLNVALLFLVIRRLTQSAHLACFGASLWGASPLHGGTLGWYSVYGHVVVVTALLVILYQLIGLTQRSTPLSFRMVLSWYVLALLAGTSFGVGLGVALALPFVILLLLPAPQRGRHRFPLMSLVVVLPALFILIHWRYESLQPMPAADMLALMSRFGATPTEPIATAPEAAMLTVYLHHWYAIVPMWFHLMTYGVTQLVLGFLYSASAYPDTVSLATATLFVICLALVASGTPNATGRRLVAFGILALGCYGSIALGRASFHLGIGISTSVTEARYHYAALIPLTLMLCALAAHPAIPPLRRWQKTALLVVWLIISVGAYVGSDRRVDHHDDAREETQRTLESIQRAIAERSPGDAVYITNRYFLPIKFPLRMSVFPGWAALFVAFYPDNTVDGRRVFFVEPDAQTLEALRRGRRTATLLVDHPPEPAPSPPTSPAA